MDSSGGYGAAPAAPPPLPVPAAQQAQVQAENAALVAELASLTTDVARTERTVREIATLNQMFSSQVMMQAHQIEQMYDQVRGPALLCFTRAVDVRR
jgi:hypothetical protein